MNIVTKETNLSDIDFREGAIVLIDKPLDWTSFAAVNKIRWILRHHYNIKKIKVGHAGTLDPLATGLLLIFTGTYTKKIESYMGMDKSYTCTIKLGAETASYDAETPELNVSKVDHIDLDQVNKSIASFVGSQEQAAPIYSALKVNGQPMYKLARQGKVLERKIRNINIYEIELISFEAPFIRLNLRCSKGTYIRSLAHDMGQALGVGGYLSALERTSIGSFDLKDALSIPEFVEKMKSENVSSS